MNLKTCTSASWASPGIQGIDWTGLLVFASDYPDDDDDDNNKDNDHTDDYDGDNYYDDDDDDHGKNLWNFTN